MSWDNEAKNLNKRKYTEESSLSELRTNGGLEMLSDEEDGWDSYSDDDEVDEFPTIVTDTEDEDQDDETENDSEAESLHIFPKAQTIISDVTKQPRVLYPEIEPDYDSDSSTEDVSSLSESRLNFYFPEKAPNRVGIIPMHWYDDLPHVGYDLNGKKVLRPAHGDELDKFLATVDNSEAWYVEYFLSMTLIIFF